jgi:acetyl esterase/lipase
MLWRFLGVAFAMVASAQQRPSPVTIPLYSGLAPAAVGQEDEDNPTLTYYAPSNATGAAIVVCPGGGYRNLALDHEGRQIADWLNGRGIAAFVLKYRLGPRYRHPAMLDDAQRAIRTVRARAAAWNLDPARVGIWGFSAGGHLASTAATRFDSGNPNAPDPVERVSSRPDILILSYPVISLTTPYTHRGSLQNLLGENPPPALAESLSNEKQVTPHTPPTFLFHTNADTGVPPENSLLFYLALRKAGVPAEMHIYETGRHGVGLAYTDPVLASWGERLTDWLRLRQFIR